MPVALLNVMLLPPSTLIWESVASETTPAYEGEPPMPPRNVPPRATGWCAEVDAEDELQFAARDDCRPLPRQFNARAQTGRW